MVEVKITLSMEEAEKLSNGMSDLLCWVRGYMAACGDTDCNSPIGQEEVREMRILLQSSMRKVDQ